MPEHGAKGSSVQTLEAHGWRRIARSNMAGRSEAYLHVPFFYSGLFELGYEAVDDIDSRMQIVEDWLERFHKYVVWCLTGNRVRGVLLWNTCRQVSAASGIIVSRAPISAPRSYRTIARERMRHIPVACADARGSEFDRGTLEPNGDARVVLKRRTVRSDSPRPSPQLAVPRDPVKAIGLYRKAVGAGVVAAQLRLGEIYLRGDMVPPDLAQAKTYLERAALQGDPRAAMQLGRMYQLGLGMPADPIAAYAWSEVAALEGNVPARHERGASLRDLKGTNQETAVARAREILSRIKQRRAQTGPLMRSVVPDERLAFHK